MKLLRTIRLDPSDTFVFPRAAAPGEWAVSGAFAFADTESGALTGKELAAFRSGFLGVNSLGWSTLAQVVEATTADREAAVGCLAQALCERFGAPDLASARAAAAAEVDFAASLCEHPVDTLIAVHRAVENGDVREAFRTLHARGPRRWRAFAFLDTDGEAEPVDEIDLPSLARDDRR